MVFNSRKSKRDVGQCPSCYCDNNPGNKGCSNEDCKFYKKVEVKSCKRK